MANKLVVANYDTRAFVSQTSRYINSEIVFYGNLQVLTFKTYKRSAIATSPDDIYTIIPPGWEYRPDQASMAIYNVPDFWWVILQANNIADVYDFKAGLNIRIPANPY